MSSYATGWAWQQSVGKGKLLLLALADLADDRGQTRTPIEVLAEMIDKDKSTVIRQLANLEEDGFISRDHAHTAGGMQLVSMTRLLIRGRPAERPTKHAAPAMRRRQENADSAAVAKCDPPQENTVFEAVAKCDPPAETPCFGPSHFATPTPEPREEGGSQNATHKEKDIYSLSKTIRNNINTISAGLSEGTHDEDVVVGADLGNLWNDWTSEAKAAPVTQARQQAVWARWVREGHADLLREAAENILTLGSFAHPQAALQARMKTGIEAKAKSSARPGGAAAGGEGGPAFAEDQRVRYGGQEMIILSVSPNGTLVTDSDATPLIPPSFHAHVEVIL
ncbi:hypothetical protein ASF71_16810 [Deinococcus sp. Leaf326]|nr:hypothetical protein ASF71_16810 [Deinococcus sp. Leaf326]